MLFEGKHSFNEQEFKISKGQNLSFMKHIHRSFEFYLQLGGTTEVVIDEKQYVLKGRTYNTPFGVYSLTYRYIIAGKVK